MVERVYQPRFVFPVLDEDDLSPEMRLLTGMQRKFVLAILETGGLDYAAAARLAGYTDENAKTLGYRLIRNAKVLAALRVEALKRMAARGADLADDLVTIASDPEEKTADRLKAIKMVMDRTGMQAVSEHRVVVDDKRQSREELLKELFGLAREAEVSIASLAGQGKVIEGTATEEKSD